MRLRTFSLTLALALLVMATAALVTGGCSKDDAQTPAPPAAGQGAVAGTMDQQKGQMRTVPRGTR